MNGKTKRKEDNIYGILKKTMTNYLKNETNVDFNFKKRSIIILFLNNSRIRKQENVTNEKAEKENVLLKML